MINEQLLIQSLRGLAGAPIDAVWLFGSQAAARTRADSDVDLAVLFSRPVAGEELLNMRSEITHAIGHEVDLIDLRSVSPILGMQVIRHGRLLVDIDRVARSRFIASLPSRYDDLMRVRRDAERALIERMSRG